MPPGRPQVFGLSKDVTLAVLPRLYMEEVLTELGRRDIDYRQVLITTLHDVMVREYQQLDSQSGPTTPDVTCHVTRRVGYGGMYDPWPWAGELVGRRGAPIEMYIESYSEGDTHTDAPTDLSMRSVNSKDLKDPERRDTRERYHITTARRTDEEQWNHEQAYTRYNTHRQEMSHDSMPQAAEIRHILERPSSEDENPSPLESREEYGRHLSTSPVSQDGEHRCREQEETNATLSSDASASPDTGQSLNSNTTTSTTCTVPERTPSGHGDQVEENTDDPGRLVSIERYIRWRSRKGYSRKKITHNLPTLPVPQHLLSSNQKQTETDDSPLNVSTASVQKKPKGKRKDACESQTAGATDEAVSSKRPKRRASSDLTVRHANGPTEPPVSEEQTSPFRRPPETQIVQYRDLSIDPPSEDQILPYWTQPKGSPLHIEWVSSLKNGSAESWKKGIEGEGKSEKDLPGSKSSTPPESSENSAATASDFSSSEMPSLPVTLNMLATRRHPQQLDIGVDPAKQQPRASQSQKIIATSPKQQEDNRAPTKQEQAKSTVPEEEAAPTAIQPEHGDAITSQSSLPTSLQETGASLQVGERTSQTRNHSLQQFALPGMWQQKERDTSPYAVATGTTSKMPLDTVHSYQTERESGRKHLTISKEVVASFQRLEEARLRGFSGNRVDDSNHPDSKYTEKGDKNSQEGMPPDIAASDPKEPSHEAMDSNAQDSVLSSVLREAVIYKKREEHSGKTSMESLHSSSIPAGPTERQLQTSDKPLGLRPAVSSYRPATEAHIEPMSSEPSTSSERRLNHQTSEVCGPSAPFPYHRQSNSSPGTQAHDGPPSTAASTSHEVMPGFQKLVQINGSTVWVPRAFAAVSPLTFPPAHVNPGRTSHEHQSSPSSHEAQVENTDRRLQREPVPMEPQEAIPARHQVDNARVGPREHQTSAEQYPYQEQPPDFVTQRDINLVIKQEPLSPLSDSVNEEERELIQGVLSGASLTESLEQQMLNSGDAPRDMDGQDGSEQQTGADEGSSSATSDVTDGGRKWQKLYHCPLCSYFTRHRGNVKQHVRVHTRERPFKCPLCDYTGARKEHVQVHMKRHTGERPFKCDHCDYRTSRKPDLVKHLRTHSGDRPYACPKCAYRAAVQSALVNHLRTHTGEKPYKCPFCNHCSARRRELAKHMGKHSEEEKNRAVEQYSRR
ncbi:PREDICTED: uncharacterized protein LOC109467264 [Branchiostoma belcheri]|uniref:Uncharacterized protein LOC109467264 n=1 Tax=Branchiostoma belcheri TaxID=7741 RepID=A0A6P4Y8I3_BRABE|nr:PREDICTED: uncharacterized protein LOC109467264 [Branchiostoma belcheri]